MIGTAEYHLAKYLDEFIKPNIPSHYMLNSTQMFLNRLKNFIFNQGDKLLSFDVVSVFTNIPLHETIELIANYFYSDESKTTPPFSKIIFKKLLLLSTGGLFMYKDRLFKQIDGVTMGSPLGPSLANFFLAHIETKLFESDFEYKPRIYMRYVDDIFVVFSHDCNFELFFNLLNSPHDNIKFTYEEGFDTIPFKILWFT